MNKFIMNKVTVLGLLVFVSNLFAAGGGTGKSYLNMTEKNALVYVQGLYDAYSSAGLLKQHGIENCSKNDSSIQLKSLLDQWIADNQSNREKSTGSLLIDALKQHCNPVLAKQAAGTEVVPQQNVAPAKTETMAEYVLRMQKNAMKRMEGGNTVETVAVPQTKLKTNNQDQINAKKQAEELARKQAGTEARIQTEIAARKQAELETKRKAKATVREKTQQQAKQKAKAQHAELESRRKAEVAGKRKAEAAAREKAQQLAKQKEQAQQAELEAKRKIEATAKKQAEEDRKKLKAVAKQLHEMPLSASTLTGRDILDESARRHDQRYEFEVQRMTLIDKAGNEEQRTLRRFMREINDNETRYLSVFLSPSGVKGVGLLTWQHDNSADDQWLYLPANGKKMKRIAKGGKKNYFMGTDYTYEDLVSESRDKFRYEKLADETIRGSQTFVVKAIATHPSVLKETGYSYRKLWIRQDNFVIVQVDFFDKRKRRIKRQKNSNLVKIKGQVWRSNRSEIEHFTKKHKTITVITKRSFNQSSVPEKNFRARTIVSGRVLR